MRLTGSLVFCIAYLVAAASPGPGIAVLVARVLGRGLPGVPAFIAGFVIGDLVWFALAAMGLAVIAQTFHMVFLIIKYAGAAYLLYLAYRLWTAPVRATVIEATRASERPLRLFLAGLALTLGNPKVMIFFLALLPTVVDLTTLTLTGMVEIALAILVILSAVLAAYALAAARARRLFTSPRALRLVNRGTGAVIAGAAVAGATR
jgi:threonine/homoserine/homoserine lactone efflux protein